MKQVLSRNNSGQEITMVMGHWSTCTNSGQQRSHLIELHNFFDYTISRLLSVEQNIRRFSTQTPLFISEVLMDKK